MPTIDLQALRDGNRRALAKAITLVESRLPEHMEQAQTVLEEILPHSGNSIRIGLIFTGIFLTVSFIVFPLYLIAITSSSPISSI